ncbi:MAG: NAD(P)H-binding protein [Gammaproteobacteria bacterium]|nr:NAD(P)H-binding protein [Gammaproteobacteria bacterium]
MQSWFITGANGNLGRRLIRTLLQNSEQDSGQDSVVAIVRSARARKAIAAIDLSAEQSDRLRIEVLDYTDVTALRSATAGSTHGVHLVGIIKESKTARYEDAHEASTSALLSAINGGTVRHVTYLSIVGSQATSDNPCLASKGRAEDMLLHSNLKACVLRVPMVLGEDDYASMALRKRAGQRSSFAFRAQSLEQPIYAADVVTAIAQAGRLEISGCLDLAGPEILTRRALTQRAAKILGHETKVRSLPISIGKFIARLLSLLPSPPMTVAMLDVLDHDDNIDVEPALRVLAMSDLTSLDEMLSRVLTR